MSGSISDLPAVLRDALRGDGQAAALLMDHFGPLVIAVIRRRLARKLRDQFDSIDFAQAVWASIFLMGPQGLEALNAEEFGRKLAAIACNKVTDEYRKRFTTQKHDIRRESGRVGNRESEIDAPSKNPSPSHVAMARECWERLLSNASPSSREILRLRLDGYRQFEIAERLGISERTVRRALVDCFRRRPEA